MDRYEVGGKEEGSSINRKEEGSSIDRYGQVGRKRAAAWTGMGRVGRKRAAAWTGWEGRG